ncbi:MAG: hypothetical protein OXJ52_00120 [Oligoflexia bacterium]|nr:hypothetical protein [Oligoflexia bacterium]
MFKSLGANQKFSFGSQLWIMFFEPYRQLFKKINWRTHFLLQPLGEEPKLLQPLLVDTYKIFPNSSILCLPFKKETWVKDIYQSWRQLDKPSFRVFIPLGCQEEELLNFWPEADSAHKLSYYRTKR